MRKNGMFGNADWGSAISAALNGFLAAGGNPAGAMNLRQMHERRMYGQQQEAEEQQYQRQRSDGMQDWQAKKEYEAAHPGPQQPHYFEDNSGNQMAIGPDGPHMVYEDPNPWKLVPNGMGGVIPVNMQELMRGQKPTGKITPLGAGGPTPQASGGFLRF